MKQVFAVFLCVVFLLFFIPSITADEYEDVSKQLVDLKKQSELLSKDITNKQENLQKLQAQLDAIKKTITGLEREVERKKQEVKQGESVLLYQRNLLNERAKSYYKNSAKNSFSLVQFLVAENLNESLKNFFYQKSLVDEDRNTIIKIVLYIKNLEEKKARLEDETMRLQAIKKEADSQSQFLATEITGAQKKQGEIRQKIAQLTGRQQHLLAQKLAALRIPHSAESAMGGCIDDRDKDPGFSPRFAFFTFGVPNRVGMNQWGAYGRAKSGQNEEQILRAYYDNFELKKDYDTGINITVEGHGVFNIEDYVKRVYEVPEKWGDDGFAVLKAQAIAARSYALAYTNNGQGSICTTEQCQVFRADPKTGKWAQAVDETKGWVMVQGGSPVKAWYSSTHGGYVLKSSEIGWADTPWTKHASDTKEQPSSLTDLRDSNKAYDKESPWFYCDWGARPEYNKTAWLKSGEVADIVNVLLLAKEDASVVSHLAQTDKSNPDGVETWDNEKIKSELKSRGKSSLNSASEISIDWDSGAGKTTGVRISGDGGSYSFDGAEFKNFFNLRAPANIQIVGPLYNVEKR